MSTDHKFLHVVISKAEGLESADTFGKNDCFVKIDFDADDDDVWPHKAKTRVIDDSNDPVFNEHFFFILKNDVELMHIKLKDDDKGGSDKIDEFRLRLRGDVDYSLGLQNEVVDVEGGGKFHFSHFVQPLSKVAECRAASTLAKAQAAELGAQVAESSAKIDALEEAMAADDVADAARAQRFAEMAAGHEEADAEQDAQIAELQAQLTEAGEAVFVTQERVEELQGEVQAKTVQRSGLRKKLDASKAKEAELETALANEDADDAVAESRIAKLEAMAAAAKAEAEANETAFQAKVEALEALLAAKDAQLQSLKDNGPPETINLFDNWPASGWNAAGGHWRQVLKSPVAFEEKPESVSFSVTIRDQGWGNRKGNAALHLFRGETEVAVCKPFGIAPHKAAKFTHTTSDHDIIAQAQVGDHFELHATVGGGGGHKLFISEFAASGVF